ncbi:arginine--tRNA ligase [Reinekea blandensis]|uniref:Arginine--tRNA ligase n=1 Tax=Reinekea blandensis MED297 TaxID=314283 RepID=A4BGC3_9GAMM|nr:arginine--tRNA ligase [Reinekea blandensis]EAR08918.1 arginyl-tRNA synthetase [Reinekea sp. MED297] [Reinekea blandensis MED297]
MKQQIASLLEAATDQLKSEGFIPADHPIRVMVDNTRDKAHGDLASNLALMLAKPCQSNPRAVAEKLIAALPDNQIVDKVEIAGPGFINFYLAGESSAEIVADILNRRAQFGTNDSGQGRKVQVEFVSANPTGPLHVGHGRNAALGDSLCRLLEANGWQPTREFYYNDAGAQINNLAISVQSRIKGLTPEDDAWPADGYRGEYIIELARSYMKGDQVIADDREVTAKADADDLDAILEFAVAYLRHEQDLDLKAFDVRFDVYSLESSLYSDGLVEATVKQLVDNGFTYEDDGAMWLKTTEFGDDKDRVMRKKDGGYTYFLPDVAYHKAKFERGFDRVINVQGADHHSTVTRVRAGLQALKEGIPEGFPDYALYQMIMVMRGGEEVKLSKRAGSYVTLRDLIEEAGRDATRYFLVSRRADAQITFDIDLATSKNNDNPVYYIQYAHARVHGVLNRLAEQNLSYDEAAGLAALGKLDLDAERELMTQLRRYPDVVTAAADALEPAMIANYLKDLAGLFHSYYNSNKMLVEQDDQRNARLVLSKAVAQVLANGLNLLGVSAPESM